MDDPFADIPIVGKGQAGSVPTALSEDVPIGPNGEALNLPPNTGANNTYGGIPAMQSDEPSASVAEDPFADIPMMGKASGSATPSPKIELEKDNPFFDISEAKAEVPWYKNLGGSLAAQTAAQSIRAAEGFERAGAAPVTDISGVNAPFQRGAKTEEATAAFDNAIADKQASLESIQGIVNKQGFTAPEYSGQINDLQREIGDLQKQKEQTLALPQYSPEAQQSLALQRQELGKTAAGLESTAKSMYPYFGVSEQDKAASAQIGRGIGNIASMVPSMLTGPAALPLMTIQGASTAYGEGYNAKAEELKQQGVTDQSEIDSQAHEAGSSAAVKTVPQLATYMIGGKLTSEATGALLKGASPLVKGLAGAGAAAAGNMAVSAGLRAAEGQPIAPTIEGTVQDLLFGAFHGLGTGLEARAEARRAREATGQPAPEVAPSANPAVNEKEAQIIAGANDQFVPAPEIRIDVEKPPLTPAFESAPPVESLEDLFLQRMDHDEGSPEYAAIQKKIDALKKGEMPPKQEPSVAEQAPQPVSGAGETPAVEPTAETPKTPEETLAGKYEDLADQQRGEPERAMRNLGSSIPQMIAEQVGDLQHRMNQKVQKMGFDYGRDEALIKIEKALRWLNPRTLSADLKEPSQKPDFSEKFQKYADEHRKLETFNEPQRLAKEAAIAVGEQRWDDARNNLNDLKSILENPEKYKEEFLDKPLKQSTEKPNAVQITSPEETLLRTQGERPSAGVELPRVGEEVPKEAPLKGEAPKEEVKPTTPTIDQNGEGMLFGNDKLPFNLAGEVMAPEPEKPPVRTAEDQELPMGEAPVPAPEAPPEPPKKSAPIRDILRRFQNGDEDGISTLQDLQKAIRDAARILRNKNLRERSAEIQEAIDVGANTEDAESLVSSTLALLEREANYADNPPKLKHEFTYKPKGGRKKYFGFEGDEIMQFVLDGKILDPAEWERRHKSGQYAGTKGGEYDAYLRGNVDIPKYYYDQIFSKKGKTRGIEEVASDLNMTPDQLWIYIDDAIKKAKSTRLEEEARNKSLKAHLDEINRLDKLKKDNPEAYAVALEDNVRAYLVKRLEREGGYFELPQIIYDAAVSIGNSIRETGKNFADWSREMASRLGDGIKNHLRQIWDAYKKSRFASESGAVDIGGGRPERFSPEEAKRRTAVKRLFDSLAGEGMKPGFEKFSDLLARKYPDLKNDPAALRELYSMASGERKGFAMPSKEAPPAAAPMAQGEMLNQVGTGLKKAVVREERLARGLEDIPQQDRQSEEERVANAVDRIKSDPSVAPSIVSRIVDSKQPHISTDDAAALLAERNRVMNERGLYERILDDESKSPAERQFAKEQLEGVEKQLERLDRAQRATGSEWGRLGHLYQRMIAEDYSLVAMETKLRRAKDAPLTTEERARLKERADKIQKINEEMVVSQDGLSNAQEQADLQNAYAKTIQELKAELAARPKVEPQIQRIIELVGSAIKSKADSARERVRQRQREGRFMTGLNPEDIIDHAIIGADYIYEGVTDITKFTTRMVKEFGEYVRPYIKDIFAASQKEFDATVIANAKARSNEVKKVVSQKPEQESIPVIKAKAKAEAFLPGFDTLDSELTHKVVYDLARQHILEGVKGEDNVMRAVHNDIKEIFPDATERDVRRAFSEYGKAKFPSKEEDRVALSEIRTLTRLQESIDRLTEGLPALRTGLQRNKATQAIREKQKQLNELLKNVKLPPTAEELVSRDAAKQTALRNRIADLDKQLRTGEKIKRTPTEPDSQATEDLRLEKNALEQLLKEVEGETKVKKSPEERYNEMRQKAVKKKIAEIQERRAKNDYQKAPKRVPPQKFEETQRLELDLKREKNEFERERIKYEEERKPRWQKILQGTSELAKGLAISGYHSIEKILGFSLSKLVSTPFEEATATLVSKLPGMAPKEGSIEVGGTLAGRLGKYYKGQIKGAKESLKVYKTGLSESEELFGKVRPNVARWYDFIGGRLHAAEKHIPFTAAEELYRYNGLSNAEKANPGSTDNPFVRAAIFKTAYEKAQGAKLQEANSVAEAINSWHRRQEQVDPQTGKSSLAGNVTSTLIKTFITKGIIKTPANYFKQVMRGIIGLPEGLGRLTRAYWNGIDNLTPKEQDAIYKAFKVGGIGAAAGIYGFIDSFKKEEDRVLGGYYQPGRKENGRDAKWGTVRINGKTFHYIAHNPVTEIMQFGSTLGRVYQSIVKKTDPTSALSIGFAKSIIALLGNAPVSGPLMRLGQPYSNPINELAGGLVPSLVANIAQDTDDGKRKPQNALQAIEARIPILQKNVPLAKPKVGGGNMMPSLPSMPKM